MSRTFGQLPKRHSNIEPLQRYHHAKEALRQRDRKAGEPLVDHTLAWLAYVAMLYAAVCTFKPAIAVAAVCSVGLADCDWLLRLD